MNMSRKARSMLKIEIELSSHSVTILEIGKEIHTSTRTKKHVLIKDYTFKNVFFNECNSQILVFFVYPLLNKNNATLYKNSQSLTIRI